MNRIRPVVAILLMGCLVVGTAAIALAVTSVAGSINIVAAANGGAIKTFSGEARRDDGSPAPEWQITNLIDGKYVTGSFVPPDSYGWASVKPPSETDPQWIVFAFDGERTRLISRVVIDPTTDSPSIIGRWCRDVEIQVSTTNPDGPYKTVRNALVVNKAIQQAFDFPPTEARYVRLLITSNHGSDMRVEMGEVEIYEAVVPDSVLDQAIVNLTNLLEDLKRYRDGQLYRQDRDTLSAVTATPAPPNAPQPTAGTEPTNTVVMADGVQLLAPQGWTRTPELEKTADNVVLALVSSQAASTSLVFTVASRPAADLAEALKLYSDLWGEQASQPEELTVAGAAARKVTFTRDATVQTVVIVANGGKGYALRMSAPKDAADAAAASLTPLLASFTFVTAQ